MQDIVWKDKEPRSENSKFTERFQSAKVKHALEILLQDQVVGRRWGHL
jgi:hypothetical protein